MSGGFAQVNPFSDYLQEQEANMKNNKPIFEGRGISRGIHFQMPFACESGLEDQGCDAKFRSDEIDMINQMEAEGFSIKEKTYSEGIFFDYISQCDMSVDGTTEKCLGRVFECGEVPWSECSKQIQTCGDNLCKYDLNNQLIKEYLKPPGTASQVAQSPEAPYSLEPLARM